MKQPKTLEVKWMGKKLTLKLEEEYCFYDSPGEGAYYEDNLCVVNLGTHSNPYWSVKFYVEGNYKEGDRSGFFVVNARNNNLQKAVSETEKNLRSMVKKINKYMGKL